MKNVELYGIQRLFKDADDADTQKLYKRDYYIENLRLFYKQDYEAVFERLYNIMHKDELLSILKNKTTYQMMILLSSIFSDAWRTILRLVSGSL